MTDGIMRNVSGSIKVTTRRNEEAARYCREERNKIKTTAYHNNSTILGSK